MAASDLEVVHPIRMGYIPYQLKAIFISVSPRVHEASLHFTLGPIMVDLCYCRHIPEAVVFQESCRSGVADQVGQEFFPMI